MKDSFIKEIQENVIRSNEQEDYSSYIEFGSKIGNKVALLELAEEKDDDLVLLLDNVKQSLSDLKELDSSTHYQIESNNAHIKTLLDNNVELINKQKIINLENQTAILELKEKIEEQNNILASSFSVFKKVALGIGILTVAGVAVYGYTIIRNNHNNMVVQDQIGKLVEYSEAQAELTTSVIKGISNLNEQSKIILEHDEKIQAIKELVSPDKYEYTNTKNVELGVTGVTTILAGLIYFIKKF